MIFCYRKNGAKSKFCVKNGNKYSKTLEMLTVAYGECTLSKKNVYNWYKLFQEGREDVNDEPLPERPPACQYQMKRLSNKSNCVE